MNSSHINQVTLTQRGRILYTPLLLVQSPAHYEPQFQDIEPLVGTQTTPTRYLGTDTPIRWTMKKVCYYRNARGTICLRWFQSRDESPRFVAQERSQRLLPYIFLGFPIALLSRNETKARLKQT